jgi:CRISPR-associated endoribonuclease cas2
MNINYIGILMYDFPMKTGKERKEYAIFRKEIVKRGYYQIQKSIYIITTSTKEKLRIIEKQLSMLVPKNSSVRSLTLTDVQFNKMKVLSGELTFGEKILKKENRILEY